MYKDAVQWAQIRRQVLTGVASQRQVARKCGIARSTVRKMVQMSAPLGFQRRNQIRPPKLGPWSKLIDEILKDDSSKPAKERRSAKEIWEWLKKGRRARSFAPVGLLV
jgi:hypothetical protein